MTVHLCNCSIGIDHDEGPTVSTQVVRTAAKEHTCCECHEPILKGTKYEYATGLYDGKWFTFRTCLTCVRIREDYCPDGYLYGGLWEALWECLGTDYVTGKSTYYDEED